MAGKGSPVYRKDKQRSIFGILTTRQLIIIMIGVFISFVLIGGSGISKKSFHFEVKAIPKQDQSASIPAADDWGALPTPHSGSAALTDETIQGHQIDVQLTEYFYSGSKANLRWPEDPKSDFIIYLNGHILTTTHDNFFMYETKPKTASSKQQDVGPLFYLQCIVFVVFILLAYIEINGTDPERYLWRFVKQYVEFNVLLTIPILGLPVVFPMRKQTRFRQSRTPIIHDYLQRLQKPSKKKRVPTLDEDQIIEKVFSSYEAPIEFSSRQKAIEIQHQKLIVQIIRKRKGALEIVFRDK